MDNLISPLYSKMKINNIEEFLLNGLLVDDAYIDQDSPDVLAVIYGLIQNT